MTREINLPLLKTDYSDQWAVAIANAMKEYATSAVLADRAAQQELGKVVVTTNESGQIVAVTRQDEDGKILSVIAEAQQEPTFGLMTPEAQKQEAARQDYAPAQQERKPDAYIRKDQLEKAKVSAMLCEVTHEPRADRIAIYTSPVAQQERKPAWHDVPNVPGLWLRLHYAKWLSVIDILDVPHSAEDSRWYGPIPECDAQQQRKPSEEDVQRLLNKLFMPIPSRRQAEIVVREALGVPAP